MSDAPSRRQLETLQREAREESHKRRTIMSVQVVASLVLMGATLAAWERHPHVRYRGGSQPTHYVSEVSHSIGLATLPAGLLVLALGVALLGVAHVLRKVHAGAGWASLALSLSALGVCTVEIVQLWLGRRNWLDSLSVRVGPSPWNQAVGVGVWLATLAAVALVINASTYVWLRHRSWKNHPLFESINADLEDPSRHVLDDGTGEPS
jgi:hypothetical protein